MVNEEKLDKFRPNYETIQGVKRQLIEAGINPDVIPHDWVEATIAAMTKWQTQTVDGLRFTVQSLKFQWTKGKDENKYQFTTADGVAHTIQSDRMFFFAGAAIKVDGGTVTVNPSQITISKKENNYCDCCGSSMHCVTTIRNPSTDKLESLCNGCIIQHESMRIRDQGKREVCDNCSRESCHLHKHYTPLLTGS